MEIAKTTRLDIRLTAVIRGKLAEEAGPYGSLSGVARRIIEAHYLKVEKNGKRQVRRALAVLLIGLCLASPGQAGEFYVSGSGGVTSFVRTIDDGNP